MSTLTDYFPEDVTEQVLQQYENRAFPRFLGRLVLNLFKAFLRLHSLGGLKSDFQAWDGNALNLGPPGIASLDTQGSRKSTRSHHFMVA